MFFESKLKALAGGILAVALWGAPAAANATTVLAQDVPALTRAASRVVHARVAETVSEWAPGGRIISKVTLDVAADWKGDGPKRIVVIQYGGEKDGFVQQVSGSTLVHANDELVAFLHPSRTLPDSFEIVGFSQGLFRVHSDDASGSSAGVESAAGRELIRFDAARGQVVQAPVIPSMPLEQFRQQVRLQVTRSSP